MSLNKSLVMGMVAALAAVSVHAQSTQSHNTVYSCANNEQIDVQYIMSSKGKPLSASYPVGSKTQKLKFSKKASSGDSLVFVSGKYRLTVDKDEKGSVSKTGGMQVTKSGYTVVNGKRMATDEIVFKACAPV